MTELIAAVQLKSTGRNRSIGFSFSFPIDWDSIAPETFYFYFRYEWARILIFGARRNKKKKRTRNIYDIRISSYKIIAKEKKTWVNLKTKI